MSHNPIGNSKHHRILLSNYFVQPEVLAFGKTGEEVRKEVGPGANEALVKSKVFEGNSTGIMFPMLTPQTLRALITLYEHEIFTQGYQFVWSVRHICTLGVLYWAVALFKNRSNGCQIRKGTCKEHLDTIERARGCEGPRQLHTSFFFSQVDTVELLTVHNVPMHNSHSAWNLGSAQVGQQRIMQIHAY